MTLYSFRLTNGYIRREVLSPSKLALKIVLLQNKKQNTFWHICHIRIAHHGGTRENGNHYKKNYFRVMPRLKAFSKETTGLFTLQT